MTDENHLNLSHSRIEWDEQRGMYFLSGRVIGEHGPREIALWPGEAGTLAEWIAERKEDEPPYLLYYRLGNRDHFVRDGDTLCKHNVRVPDPDSEDLKPLSQVTEREWRLITSGRVRGSDLCTDCYSSAVHRGLIPDEIPDGLPKFPCPECGDTAERITGYAGNATVEHEDGRTHTFDASEYEVWRRGG